MATTIPIANLYYLLAYAWDHKLSEAELVAIDADSCPDLNNLFAKILANATHHLVRRGLDRSYVPFEEETPRIRGRIDFSASEKIQTRTRGKLVCIYDELSPDVLHNQIVKATLRVLRNDPRVHADSRKRLAQSLEAFHEVGDLRVTPRDFHRVQLHRNNRAYRFILHLCELIHASLLPDKSQDGTRRFRDFTRDEKIMAKVFEDFVRNFAGRHCPEANVSAMHIGWCASDLAEGTSAMLPRMITDVTVAWPDRKLILDCKYYQEALVSAMTPCGSVPAISTSSTPTSPTRPSNPAGKTSRACCSTRQTATTSIMPSPCTATTESAFPPLISSRYGRRSRRSY